MTSVTLSLPSHLAAALTALARERGASLDKLARGMLDRELMRMHTAQATARARDNRLAQLQHLLAPDFERAKGWRDLQARLALYGVTLRRTDGAESGLHLCDLITGEELCPTAALGFDGRALKQRYGADLAPGGGAVAA